jgi:hypothetical protein
MCEGKVACAVNNNGLGNKMILDLSLTWTSSSLWRDVRQSPVRTPPVAGMAKILASALGAEVNLSRQ